MLKLVINHIFDGIIWKIIPSHDNRILAIEVRNTELRSVFFSVLHLDFVDFINHNLSIKEPWWVGIEAVSEQHLYVHGYDSLLYAQHKGIFCLDHKKKIENWSLPNHTFIAIENNNLMAKYKNEIQKINLINGQIIEINPKFDNKNNQISENEILRIFDEDAYFVKLQTFIFGFSGIMPVKLIEYLDFEEYILISFYENLADNYLKNYFYILDKNTKIEKLKVILADNVVGVATNSFCILKNKLVLCKDKNTLLIYEI